MEPNQGQKQTSIPSTDAGRTTRDYVGSRSSFTYRHGAHPRGDAKWPIREIHTEYKKDVVLHDEVGRSFKYEGYYVTGLSCLFFFLHLEILPGRIFCICLRFLPMQQRFWIHPLHTDTSAFTAYRMSLGLAGYTGFTVRAVIDPTTSTEWIWSSPEAS